MPSTFIPPVSSTVNHGPLSEMRFLARRDAVDMVATSTRLPKKDLWFSSRSFICYKCNTETPIRQALTYSQVIHTRKPLPRNDLRRRGARRMPIVEKQGFSTSSGHHAMRHPHTCHNHHQWSRHHRSTRSKAHPHTGP